MVDIDIDIDIAIDIAIVSEFESIAVVREGCIRASRQLSPKEFYYDSKLDIFCTMWYGWTAPRS